MSTAARFLNVPRNWAVRFLPYMPDDAVTKVIGYPNPNRGYGYGEWVEFYEKESECRDRFDFLTRCGVIERAEIRKENGTMIGALVTDWQDVS